MEWKNLLAKAIVCLLLSGGNAHDLQLLLGLIGIACLQGSASFLYQKSPLLNSWFSNKTEYPPMVNSAIAFCKLVYAHFIELITDR